MLFRAALIALALSGVLNAVSCTRLDRVKDERDQWRKTSQKWERAWNDQKRAYDQSEANRETENDRAKASLEQVRQACEGKMDAVRKAEAAKRRIHAKPITFDAKGCPDRTLVPTNEWGR